MKRFRLMLVVCTTLLNVFAKAQNNDVVSSFLTLQLVPNNDSTLLQFKVPIEKQNGLLNVYVYSDYNDVRSLLPFTYYPGTNQKQITVSVDDEGTMHYLFRDLNSHLPGRHTYRVVLNYETGMNYAAISYSVSLKPVHETTDSVSYHQIQQTCIPLHPEVTLKVYSLSGQEVYTTTIPRPENLQNPAIDFSLLPLAQGVYIGKLFSNADPAMVKIAYNESKIPIVIN